MLAQGTKISFRGKQTPIETLEDWSWHNQGETEERELDTPFGLQVPEGIVETGERECTTLTTALGHSITLTPDHEILCYKNSRISKIQVKDLAPQDILILIQGITGDTISKQDGRKDFLYPPALRPKARANKEKMAAADTLQKEDITPEMRNWFRVLRRANAYADKITKIEPAGKLATHDVWKIEKGHVFYANGFVVGN